MQIWQHMHVYRELQDPFQHPNHTDILPHLRVTATSALQLTIVFVWAATLAIVKAIPSPQIVLMDNMDSPSYRRLTFSSVSRKQETLTPVDGPAWRGLTFGGTRSLDLDLDLLQRWYCEYGLVISMFFHTHQYALNSLSQWISESQYREAMISIYIREQDADM